MRLIGVLAPNDPFAAGSMEGLASLGWEVDALLTAMPGERPFVNSAVRVHDGRPLALQPTSLHARIGRAALDRIDLAASRTSARVMPVIQARTGVEIDLTRIRHRDSRAGDDLSPDAREVLNEISMRGSYSHERGVNDLASLVRKAKPDVVLSFGSLAAAYVYASTEKLRPPVWIVSGMAVDLLWVLDEQELRRGPADILCRADGYLAEGERDEALARRIGFAGSSLMAPGGVGALGAGILGPGSAPTPTSERKTIVVDGRHDVRHRGLVAIAALRLCASSIRRFRIVVVSPPDEVRIAAELARTDCGLDITSSPRPASMCELLSAQAEARASVSLSAGEAADPWSLAAMAVGSFPIQAAGMLGIEGVDGETTIFVHPDEPAEVAAALTRAIDDDALVNRAHARNRVIAGPSLQAEVAAEKLIGMRRDILAARK